MLPVAGQQMIQTLPLWFFRLHVCFTDAIISSLISKKTGVLGESADAFTASRLASHVFVVSCTAHCLVRWSGWPLSWFVMPVIIGAG